MTLILNGSNGVSDVDGSAATPAVRGTDANTGMFFPAADIIAFATAGTEDFRIGSAGELGIQGANYGTSGQVLTSGGSGAAPSWAAATGGQIQSQTFTANGTWTAPSGVTRVRAYVFGGGGGNYGSSCGSTTGGFGGFAVGDYAVTPGTGYAVTVGAGGAGVTSGTGTAGGTSSFAAFASATGGGGGSSGGGGVSGSGSGGTLRNGNSQGSIGAQTAIIQGTTRSSGNTAFAYTNTNNAYIGAGGTTDAAARIGTTGAVYFEWVG